MTISNNNNDTNILEPLVDALIGTTSLLFKVGSMAFDGLGNIMYRIIEGKPFEGNVESEEGIVIDNIIKYKYIPLGDLESKLGNNKLIHYRYVEGDKEGVKACIGYDMEGREVWFDMCDSHTLVAGASRWGKSSALNVIITSLMLSYTENEVAFMGCDLKRSDVYYYQRYRHFRGSVATDHSEFLKHMAKLEDEMLKRSEILDKANCRNVIKYNKVNDEKLSYIIYVIDELPLLTSNNKCTDKLRLIMGQCASYGIYFILASQDATKDTIGKCKMNCSQTIGLHTKDETDSKTIIGSDILKDITVKGRCHFDNGAATTEAQIFFLEEEEIEDLLKDKLKEKYKNGVCV
ncbi:MAG: FtsK/SpoIIIE domain-containing protein [Paraclostridium sp.]